MVSDDGAAAADARCGCILQSDFKPRECALTFIATTFGNLVVFHSGVPLLSWNEPLMPVPHACQLSSIPIRLYLRCQKNHTRMAWSIMRASAQKEVDGQRLQVAC